MQIPIYRNGALHLNVSIAENSNIKQDLNGKDVCQFQFESITATDVQIGDYVDIVGKRYTLNLLPEVKKTGNRRYAYDCMFEGRMYELSKILFTDGVNSEFFLTGDLEFFIDLIIQNLNRVQSGWSKGVIQYGVETKNLQFSNENCLAVLQRLCTEYSVDFHVNEDKTIDTGQFGTELSTVFSYGKGKGLYSLSRKTVESKSLFTRLWPYGGQRNIPANYRNYSTRLKLSTDYIEQNTSIYGVIEVPKIFDDIYPRFKGTVTTASANNVFICSSMDFDINTYMLAGTSPKIHFNSGQLAGYEFELISYNNSTKEFTLKHSEQEKAMSEGGLTPFILPNDTIKMVAGDEFVILDITMPDSYVTAAEAELLAAANTFLSQNCDPRVNYTLEIDPLFMQNLSINVGDYIPILDADLGIDKLVRVIGIEKSIYSPIKWKVELSDYTSPKVVNQMLADLEDIRRLIIVNKLSDIAKAKRNWKTSIELRDSIFDSDGYFDPENIKPLSIETSMLTVGTRAGNFTLSSTIEPNYTRDPSKIRLGAGTLVHFQIEDNIRTWTITENIVTGLVSGTTYYIYARCTRLNSSAILTADTTQRKVDSDALYYYFPVGILTSVIDGWRDAVMTYGQSYMVGRMLNVGQITGQNGLIINLDTGEITGKITFSNGLNEDDILGSEPIEQADIISYFPCDEMIGSKLYDEIGGTTGSVVNTRSFEKGVINNCFVSGVNNCYGFVDEMLIKQSFSIGIWINGQTTWNVSSDILRSAEANGFRISTVTGTRQIVFRVRSSSNTETTLTTYTPSDIDSWHHIGFVYDGTTGLWVAYWDGVNVATGTNLVTRSASDNIDMYIGFNQTSSYLICRIDEIYICGDILTEKKIKYLFLLRDALSRHSVQTVIDGGIVTTGLIQLGDGATVKAGINGGGTLDSEVRGWAGATYANRASAPYRYLQDGSFFSTKGTVGGWTIDTDAIYSGTKSTGDGFSASGMTLAANGSIHTPRFYINSDGKLGFRSSATGKRISINSDDNRIDLYDSSNVNVVSIDDSLDSVWPVPGLLVRDPAYASTLGMISHSGLMFLYRGNFAISMITGPVASFYFSNLPTHANNSNDWGFLKYRPSTGEIYYNTVS
jgi:hypothetical protein